MNFPAEMTRLIEVSTTTELHKIMMSADQNTLDTGREEGWIDADGYVHDAEREARVFVSSYASLCDDRGIDYPEESWGGAVDNVARDNDPRTNGDAPDFDREA